MYPQPYSFAQGDHLSRSSASRGSSDCLERRDKLLVGRQHTISLTPGNTEPDSKECGSRNHQLHLKKLQISNHAISDQKQHI